MFARFVDYLCTQLIANRTIESQDRELYAFGIRALFTQSAHVFLVLLCGYCYGLFFESILFLATYMPLRIYAGGYHASTNTRCFVSSIFMVIVVFAVVNCVPLQLAFFIALLLGFIAGAVIFRYAPVGNANKPLDELEQVIYRKKAICVALMIIAGAVICFYLALPTYGLTLSLSLFAESALILVEIRKQRREGIHCM